jgi:hypothetical protein
MKLRMKKYEEVSPVEFLLLRERLGIRRYRKSVGRDEDEKKILLDLAPKKMRRKKKTILF